MRLRFLRVGLLLLLFSSVFLIFDVPQGVTVAQLANGDIDYRFIVDNEGFTSVNINYRNDGQSGSTWILVPKMTDWTNETIHGTVTDWSLSDTENLTGTQLYFYEALFLSFTSDPSVGFEIAIHYSFSTAAMIIEPNGIFYSPQIGFEEGNRLQAEIIFPLDFTVNQDEIIAGGENVYQPTFTNSNYVSFDNFPSSENLVRIEIGFMASKQTPELTTIRSGIFTFESVKRYETYARSILNLYSSSYLDLVDLFNVTLGSAGNATDGIKVRFFLPDFASLLSVGGYVPFSEEQIGDIHINIVFTRFIPGYIEVIALHELVHHFLWQVGISPESLLWFHEGMAQYISVETAEGLGYEGATFMKDELETGVSDLLNSFGNQPNLGFLKDWTPSNQPESLGILYVGAYYVVSRLAEPRKGLQYYFSFFRNIKGAKIEDTVLLSYYLSLAANESIASNLNTWGFDVPDLYDNSALIDEVTRAVNGVNPVFQPYKFLAEHLYQQGLKYAGAGGSAAAMQEYFYSALTVARFAAVSTLLTWSGVVFILVLLVLRRKGVFSDSKASYI